MKVKIEFDSLKPGCYGNVYEDDERLKQVQSVLVYVDSRTDEFPIYCVNLPTDFANIVKAGIKSLAKQSDKVKTKTNRAVKDVLSDVVNAYEKMKPTIMKCINEDIFYPGEGEQILRNHRELKKSLENIDLEEG